jgi:hypothetical protein
VQRRINVRGTSGSGKTTLAAELARRLRVPHIELDGLHHGPNWAEASTEEFRGRVQAALDASPDGWVVDGNYEGKLDRMVIDAADTVVWLDMPVGLFLRRLYVRTSHRINHNVELWNGNRESWRTALVGGKSLFVWAVRSWFRHRREWPAFLGSHPGYVRLQSTAEVRAWLATVSEDTHPHRNAGPA